MLRQVKLPFGNSLYKLYQDGLCKMLSHYCLFLVGMESKTKLTLWAFPELMGRNRSLLPKQKHPLLRPNNCVDCFHYITYILHHQMNNSVVA